MALRLHNPGHRNESGRSPWPALTSTGTTAMRPTAEHAQDTPDGAPFHDGLGDRRLVIDPDTREVLEHLDLVPELGAQERAIRERVERLSNFRNVRFPRLHQVLSEKVGQSTIVSVVAEHAPGQRFSDLLAYVDRHPTLVFDVNAVLQVAREVLPALAVLHDSRGVTHGALGLERLVLSPHGRVGIVDYALGAALTKLQFPRTRLWRDFRIAMPPSAGIPRFDARADVAGIALALLALLAGRPLAGGEFPNAVRSLLDSAVERLPNGTVRQLSTSLKGWFERALPIESRKPYGSAQEAQLGLEDALKRESSYSPSSGALKSFLQRYESSKPRKGVAQGQRPASAAQSEGEGTAALPAATVPAEPASRPGRRRRLTPEEESAEEIRAMEAELARLAREEAASAAVAPPEPPATLEAALDSPASPRADEQPPAASDEAPSPIAAVAAPPPVTEPAAAPVGGEAPPASEFVTLEDQIEAEIEAGIEVEIVSLGKELPKVDIAALANDALSIVVAADARSAPAAAAEDEEIRSIEALLRDLDTSTPPVEPPRADEVADQVAAEQVTGPGWMLTPPPDGPTAIDLAADLASDETPVVRDERTPPLDFDAAPVPDYVVRLFRAGAVTAHLVAGATRVPRPDVYRLQMFAAVAPSTGREVLEAASACLPTRAHRSAPAALPEHATPVEATLATRQAGVLEVAAHALRSKHDGSLLRLVAAGATARPQRHAVASLPAEALPVAASLVKVAEPALLRAIAAAQHEGASSLLRLVQPPVAPSPAEEPPPAVAVEAPVEAMAPSTPAEAAAPQLSTARDVTAALEAELERLLAQTGLDQSLDASPIDVQAVDEPVGPPAPEVAPLAERRSTPVVEEPPAVQEAPAADLVPPADAAPAAPALEADSAVAPASRKRSRGGRRKSRPSPTPAPPAVVPFERPEPAPEPAPRIAPRAEPVAPASAPAFFERPAASAAPPRPVEPLPFAPAAAAAFAEPGMPAVARVRSLPEDPWKVEAEAAKVPQVIPFTPRAVESPEPSVGRVARSDDGRSREGKVEEATAPATESVARPAATIRSFGTERRASDVPSEPASPPTVAVEEGNARGWRIHWRRTAAASFVVILLEGVAFATAYWLVKPSEMGTLLVETLRPGVEVLVDGRSSGRTPVTTQLKPGRHTLELRVDGASKVIPVEISPGVQTTQQVKWPAASRLGRLKVTTTPPGARILVDGQYRGASPVVLDDVPVGPHAIVAESSSGTVRSKVDVGDNELAELDLGIFSGWLTVFAPVEVRIFESGKLLGTSLDGKLLVPPGTHEIELVNTRLGYRETRTVDIEPGKHTPLSVTGPSGSIVIDAPDGTEVLVDGQPAGTTPLESIKAPIGTREVVLKHPALGQRRMTVTVRADAPSRLSLLAPQ